MAWEQPSFAAVSFLDLEVGTLDCQPRLSFPGLLLIDKPRGPTSHDIVLGVRRGSGEKRVGHAGTLDPMATGLLVACLGTATRLSEYLRAKEKSYVARLRLGQTTDTYDADGCVVAESNDLPDQAAVEAALARFRGRIEQRPPSYSAVKRNGFKAYELTRRGEPPLLEPRPVEIILLELTAWQSPECELRVVCSAGTYIRSLAHDLGQALGCGAHLTGLRRTACGAFGIEAAVAWADLRAAFAAGEWRQYLLPSEAAVADWPRVELSAEAAAQVRYGRSIALAAGAPEWGRAYDPAGVFIALLRADREVGVWRPHKVLVDAPSRCS